MTIKEKYSKENISTEIIKRIEKKFGSDHKVRVALFKAISEYDDENDNYNPILILIDENYAEIEHDIRIRDLCPNSNDQWKYYDENSDMLTVDDVTVKF